MRSSLITLILILFISNSLFSFQKIGFLLSENIEIYDVFSSQFLSDDSEGWKIEIENDSIRVESRKVDCIKTNLGFDRELVLLKFTNLTSEDLIFSYDLEIYRNQICTTCDKMPEYHYELLLKANSSIEGDCLSLNLNHLKIFSHFLEERYRFEKDDLSAFKFDKIIISEIKK